MNKTYLGGCHCGAVRYSVDLELTSAVSCNCSLCSKAGWLLTFVPASQFTLTSGGEVLTDYQFNKWHIHHTFCKTCGVRSFSRGTGPDGTESIAINLRCLDDIDLTPIPVTFFDGKSL